MKDKKITVNKSADQLLKEILNMYKQENDKMKKRFGPDCFIRLSI
jgi:hypothetical protein